MSAILPMLAAVVLYGFYPVVASNAAGSLNPVVLIAGAQSFATVLQLFALGRSLNARGLTLASTLRTLLLSRAVLRWGLAQGLLNSCAHIALMISFIFINDYAAALIYDMWPMLLVVLLPLLVKSKERATLKDWVFSGVSAGGLILIIDAKAAGSQLFEFDASQAGGASGLGVLAAIAAMVFMALTSAISIILQGLSSKVLFPNAGGEPSTPGSPVGLPKTLQTRSDIASSIAASFVGHFSSMLVSTAALLTWIAFGDGGGLGTIDTWGDAYLILAAGTIVSAGAVFFIYANSRTRLPSINILYNLTPLLGLVFLYIFGAREEIPGQVLLGGMLVVAANLAISLRVELSAAYYACLLALCGAAVYCFFVPGVSTENYYGAVGVPAGIFAILTAFMTERIASRQVQQESLAVRVMSVARAASDSGVDMAARRFISNIFAVQSARAIELETGKFLDSIAGSSQELLGLGVQLAANRTRIFAFGEVFVLWLVGGCTLILSLVGRPSSIEASMLAVVLAATIAFLCFLVLDPVNVRRGRFLVELLTAGDTQHDEVCIGLEKENRDFSFMAYIASAFSLILFLLFATALWLDTTNSGPIP